MAGEFDRKQIENLLGGYTAGTLTPGERKALFEAALQDQALFEALADEEPLRELLADPVARAELREVLRPPARPAVLRWLPAFGGLAIAALMIMFVVQPWQHNRPTEPTVEIAENRVPVVEAPPAQAPAPEAKAKTRVKDRVAQAPERSTTIPPPPAAPPPVMGFREMASADQAAPGRTFAGAVGMMKRSSPRMAAPQPELSVTVQRNGLPVDPATTEFSKNDSVRLAVAPPTAGHLYALQHRGAEQWRFIFPADTASETASRVEPRATYLVPAGTSIQSNEPGEITVLLFFSQTPLNLEPGADALVNLGLKSREIHLQFR
jgi:hypothetical protein